MNKIEILKEFCAPGVEWRGKPFWSWNGELRREELIRQIHVMKEMGFGGYFMHSRSGLITEYLGDEWFDLICAVADEGEKLGMESWLYDEDRWPSGSAGGKVTVDPQYRQKSLRINEMSPELYEKREDTYDLFIAKLDDLNMWAYKRLPLDADVNAEIAALAPEYEDKSGEWKVLRFEILPDAPNSNYNGTTYIDTMSYAAVRRFIELTHEEYKKRCGDRLGRSIKGIFADEPSRGRGMDKMRIENGVRIELMCWTNDIFEQFEARYGYDGRAVLPELFYYPNGSRVAPIKLHYFDLANNLFIERFAMQINDWCKENNIIFTGHVLHEDSLSNQTVPNGSLMRFYEAMGYPGVDVLTEHNNGYWIVKQLSSATRQLGQKWLLSELYGCTGWQMPFKSHKTVGDWQALFGINLRCQHLSWYTMEGESKRDYPASILHQSPWYPYYDSIESYFARFGLVMQQGSPDCDVLMLNPIESVWCQAHLGWARWINSADPIVQQYEKRYREMFYFLTNNHIDFDYGEEDIMRRHYSIEKDENGAMLRIGEATYRVVVLGNMLTIRQTTIDILKEFIDAGGKVIIVGDSPEYVDAVPVEGEFALNAISSCVPYDSEALACEIRKYSEKYVDIKNENGEVVGDVYVQVRDDFAGGKAICMICVGDAKVNPRRGLSVRVKADKKYHVQRWDFTDGARYDADADSAYENGYITIKLDLLPAETACFVLCEEYESLPEYTCLEEVSSVTVKGEFEYKRSEQNVLVLDFCRWRWKDGEWSDIDEVLKIDRAVRENVGIEHRGGEMLQPWFSKLHHNQSYGDIELQYEFDIEKLPQEDIILAGERPEFNDYYINGVRLESTGVNDIWVDEAFKRMPIPANALKLGKNVVTVKTDFKRTSNIEALYVVGEFGVRGELKNAAMTSLPEKLSTEKSFAEQALTFYSGNVTYKLSPDMYELPECQGCRIYLSPESFTGACVVVEGEGIEKQVLMSEPYEADITEAVMAGKDIYVTVAGTRRNTFGPLHQNPPLVGAYGPGNFVTSGEGWMDEYSLLGSGLSGIVIKQKR